MILNITILGCYCSWHIITCVLQTSCRTYIHICPPLLMLPAESFSFSIFSSLFVFFLLDPIFVCLSPPLTLSSAAPYFFFFLQINSSCCTFNHHNSLAIVRKFISIMMNPFFSSFLFSRKQPNFWIFILYLPVNMFVFKLNKVSLTRSWLFN